MKRIDLIAGARPNFMKIAPIIDALNAAETRISGKRRDPSEMGRQGGPADRRES